MNPCPATAHVNQSIKHHSHSLSASDAVYNMQPLTADSNSYPGLIFTKQLCSLISIISPTMQSQGSLGTTCRVCGHLTGQMLRQSRLMQIITQHFSCTIWHTDGDSSKFWHTRVSTQNSSTQPPCTTSQPGQTRLTSQGHPTDQTALEHMSYLM